MVNQRSLSFGDVLAGRYVLQDQVSESLGVRNWRATDQQLHRNVRVELLSADDDRAENFIEAAQRSTVVTDHRFLPVLDLLTNEQGFHAVVREWARATPLHLLVAQAPLSNERTAVLVAELSEAIAHAHSLGVHHRRLTPHQVLLKQTGAVRIVGLGVQTALAPPEQHVSDSDIERYVTSDVQALGKVLYACLVGRWPGGHVDGLRAAPTEHGHLMRPRQVRAGISRRLDNICDRILQPERHPRDALTDAASIAAELRALTGFHDVVVAPARQSDETDTDLLRQDPVVVPFGPRARASSAASESITATAALQAGCRTEASQIDHPRPSLALGGRSRAWRRFGGCLRRLGLPGISSPSSSEFVRISRQDPPGVGCLRF